MAGGFGFERPCEGATNDWLTPPELVRRLGHFDLDPCGCMGMPWKLADNVYIPPQDGLALPWLGRVFCNPPYGDNIAAWADAMARHGDGILLIFSRTETDAWLGIWGAASAILFPHGRIAFLRPDGTRGVRGGTAPSALVAYGQENVSALRGAGIAGALVSGTDCLRGIRASRL